MAVMVDLFLASNLPPKRTGLPICVWISTQLDDGSVRIWVSHSAHASPSEFVTVSIQTDVRILNGEMADNDLELLRRWVSLNHDTIVKHWQGEIPFSQDAIAAIVPL